jgi:hypothetical protein
MSNQWSENTRDDERYTDDGAYVPARRRPAYTPPPPRQLGSRTRLPWLFVRILIGVIVAGVICTVIGQFFR